MALSNEIQDIGFLRVKGLAFQSIPSFSKQTELRKGASSRLLISGLTANWKRRRKDVCMRESEREREREACVIQRLLGRSQRRFYKNRVLRPSS